MLIRMLKTFVCRGPYGRICVEVEFCFLLSNDQLLFLSVHRQTVTKSRPVVVSAEDQVHPSHRPVRHLECKLKLFEMVPHRIILPEGICPARVGRSFVCA